MQNSSSYKPQESIHPNINGQGAVSLSPVTHNVAIVRADEPCELIRADRCHKERFSQLVARRNMGLSGM